MSVSNFILRPILSPHRPNLVKIFSLTCTINIMAFDNIIYDYHLDRISAQAAV